MLPVGEVVDPPGPAERPARGVYEGRRVRLAPADPDDAPELFAASHGDPERERLWTYMGYGPFADAGAMRAWLEGCAASDDPLFLTVSTREPSRRVGVVSFMNVVPAARRLEIGHIWYVPEAQRGAVNTETVYLMLVEAFDKRGNRRVEWKCDALNARSRAAALRLGFSFEGVFDQHLIVKGRNRDTAWYAMLDSDWPRVRANMERWLSGEERGLSLAALNAPLVRRRDYRALTPPP